MRLASVLRPIAIERSEERRAARRVPSCVVHGAMLVGEGAIIFGSGVLVHWLAPLVWDASWARHIETVGLGTILALNIISFLGGYRPQVTNAFGRSLACALAGWAATLTVLVVLRWRLGIEGGYATGWFVNWALSSAAGLVFLRTMSCLLIGRKVGATRRVAIVGCGAEGQTLLSRYATDPEGEFDIVGVFEDRLERSPQFCWSYPLRGNLDALLDFARDDRLDDVIVALPFSAGDRLRQIFAKLRVLPANVYLAADPLDIGDDAIGLERIGGVPVIRVIPTPLGEAQRIAKEIEDRVLGAIILALISPLLVFIALLIKLDSPGPFFFRQMRLGYSNRLIEVFKFRTMRTDLADPNAERLTSRDDVRVTRVGRILRRTSLDELPQFINVVRGEMSIVGPRPHARAAKAGGLLYPDAVEAYAARHKVKPGITGLAQIKGWRGETRTVEQIRQRVAHDMIYIRNWTLWLDLKIIAITAFTGFFSRDAY